MDSSQSSTAAIPISTLTPISTPVFTPVATNNIPMRPAVDPDPTREKHDEERVVAEIDGGRGGRRRAEDRNNNRLENIGGKGSGGNLSDSESTDSIIPATTPSSAVPSVASPPSPFAPLILTPSAAGELVVPIIKVTDSRGASYDGIATSTTNNHGQNFSTTPPVISFPLPPSLTSHTDPATMNSSSIAVAAAVPSLTSPGSGHDSPALMGASLLCDTTEVTFFVRAETLYGQHIHIIGDQHQLGNWRVSKSVTLTTNEETYPVWTCKVVFPRGAKIEYKYIVKVESKYEKLVRGLKQWENLKVNRSLVTAGLTMTVDDGHLGKCSTDGVQIYEGYLAELSEFRINVGCRVAQPFKLNNPKPIRLKMLIKPETLKSGETMDSHYTLMNLTAHRCYTTEDGIPKMSGEVIIQPDNGWLWTPGDFFLFSSRFSNNVQTFTVLIEYFEAHSNHNDPPFAMSVVSHGMLPRSAIFPDRINSSGVVTTPILQGNIALGTLYIDYLYAFPFEHPLNNLQKDFSIPWLVSGVVLNIGHRGLGQSQTIGSISKRKVTTTENTIHSFVQAAQKGADFIEFDVQLSKDRVPIVYHNFDTVVSLQKIGSNLPEFFNLAVNSLTRKQLQTLKLEYSSGHGVPQKKMFAQLLWKRLPELISAKILSGGLAPMDESSLSDSRSLPNSPPLRPQQTPLPTDLSMESLSLADPIIEDVISSLRSRSNSAPLKMTRNRLRRSKQLERIKSLKNRINTLEDVFKKVPIDVGFNVEIKYMDELVGSPYQDGWDDKNDYVDTILKCIFENADGRHIVISSFDPDICTLARLKQPIYPVFFLTTGGDPDHENFKDIRSMSLLHAVSFAVSEKLLGICSYSKPLLDDEKLVERVKEAGLLLFTWGENNNDPNARRRQVELGVDAVIHDSVDQIDVASASQNKFGARLIRSLSNSSELSALLAEGKDPIPVSNGDSVSNIVHPPYDSTRSNFSHSSSMDALSSIRDSPILITTTTSPATATAKTGETNPEQNAEIHTPTVARMSALFDLPTSSNPESVFLPEPHH